MKVWTLIKNNVVENVVLWDGISEWSPPDGYTLIDITDMENGPGPGWTYENDAFIAPVVEEPEEIITPDPNQIFVPRSITRRQCSLELLKRQMITDIEALNMTRNGIPPAPVMSYIEALPSEQQVIAQIDFAADNYYRNNALLNAMMNANGWNEDDIDNFFIEAAKL